MCYLLNFISYYVTRYRVTVIRIAGTKSRFMQYAIKFNTNLSQITYLQCIRELLMMHYINLRLLTYWIIITSFISRID